MSIELKSNRQSLRRLLSKLDGRIAIAIGVSNGMEAKLLYKTIADLYEGEKIPDYVGGFITFVSGYLAAANAGLPDLGLILREEITRQTKVIEQATWLSALNNSLPALPIGVDIDTGYGNEPLSTILTCRNVYKAGGQYVQIEDQLGINKSCGHMAGGHGTGKEIISKEEMVELRIKPAVDFARSVEDFMVMARTDAIAVEGFGGAIERGHAYIENGAEMIFIEAISKEADMEEVVREYSNTNALTVANMIERSPFTPYKNPMELHGIGYDIGLYSIGGIMTSLTNLKHYYQSIAKGNSPFDEAGFTESEWFNGFSAFIGRNQVEKINMHYRHN